MYLAFLLLVDAGFLCCLIVVGTDFLRNTSVAHSNGFCQVLPFLTYVFGFLSVYTVVCFTVERFIVTFYPLKRQTICTRKRAKIALLFVSVTAVILFSFPLYMSDVIYSNGEHICILRHEFMFAAHVLSCMDTVLTMVLPALIILVLNTAIGVKLSKQFSKDSDAALGRRMCRGVNGSECTLLSMSRKSVHEHARGSGTWIYEIGNSCENDSYFTASVFYVCIIKPPKSCTEGLYANNIAHRTSASESPGIHCSGISTVYLLC